MITMIDFIEVGMCLDVVELICLICLICLIGVIE